MLKVIQNKQLNQVSLTGIRALVLLGLLMEAPRSLEEIKRIFVEYKIMEISNSNDILRIDINTLRTMGCEIIKGEGEYSNKYVLKKHIFTFDVSDEEINLLKRAYNRVKESENLYLLLEYDELFRKITNYINNDETIEHILGISVFRFFDIDLIKKLIKLSGTNKIVELEYQSPTRKNTSIKRVIVEKVAMRSHQLYIYGFDFNNKKSIMLNIKNILKIIGIIENLQKYDIHLVNVKFKIKEIDNFQSEENEKIIETDGVEGIIQGSYYNEFVAIQRILSLGENCIVLEPSDFKMKIIDKLQNMKEIYKDG